MRDFRDLKVWKKAHTLTLDVYRGTEEFPREEQFELTRQIRKAAVSISANIAEGCGRDGDAELARFLQIAMGSASELEYHLLLAKDLTILPQPAFEELAEGVVEVKRMLAAFIKKLKADG